MFVFGVVFRVVFVLFVWVLYLSVVGLCWVGFMFCNDCWVCAFCLGCCSYYGLVCWFLFPCLVYYCFGWCLGVLFCGVRFLCLVVLFCYLVCFRCLLLS